MNSIVGWVAQQTHLSPADIADVYPTSTGPVEARGFLASGNEIVFLQREKGSRSLQINLPNILTVLRILLTPLLVIFLQRGMMHFALLVFTLSAISDGLDGLIARLLDQRTTLGAYLDPIADKLLLAVAYISLAMLEIVPGWLSVIVISRDILIVLGVAVCTITGVALRIRPSKISKCTTVVQLSTIFLVLFNANISIPAALIPPMIWITAGITTLSGLHYTYVGLNMIHEDPEGDDSLRRQ